MDGLSVTSQAPVVGASMTMLQWSSTPRHAFDQKDRVQSSVLTVSNEDA